MREELFGISENKIKINEYYTTISSFWEEIDFMNLLPVVTTIADDVTVLLRAIETQKEESRLFVFLSELDESSGALKSQSLMQNFLPTVKAAYAMLQQKESQRDGMLFKTEHTAMYNKDPVSRLSCTICGGKNHTSDKCGCSMGFQSGITNT